MNENYTFVPSQNPLDNLIFLTCVIRMEKLHLQLQLPDPATLKDDYGSRLCAKMFEHSSYCYCMMKTVLANVCMFILMKTSLSCHGLGIIWFLLLWWAKAGPWPCGKNPRSKDIRRSFLLASCTNLKKVKKGLFGDWNDSISGYYCTC